MELAAQSTEDLRLEHARLLQEYARLKSAANRKQFGSTIEAPGGGAPAGGPDGLVHALPDESRREITGHALRTSKRARVENLHVGYRISGHTTFPVPNTLNQTGIRFETSYRGQYFEQYYVILEFSRKDEPAVHRHTLPPFVPIAQLVPTLARGIKAFMNKTAEYLNAYVSRRQQLLEVRDQHAGVLHKEAETSPAFDFIRLVLKAAPLSDEESDGEDDEPPATTTIRLLYEDLASTRPSQCVVRKEHTDGNEDVSSTLQEDLELNRDPAWEAEFLKQSLPAALSSLL